MGKKIRSLIAPILSVLILSSCTPVARTVTPQVVQIYASAAAGPWLPDLYTCAETFPAVIRVTGDPSQADIYLRIGQPEDLSQAAYQIDTEDIQVVTHRESPVQNLSLGEAQAVFAGSAGESLEIWVFAPGQDVQQVFDKDVMQGIATTSLAHLAVNPQQMSDVLNSDKNAVGILPRHWKAGTVRDVYTISGVPVLAISSSEPEGIVGDLLACLQK